MRPFFIPQKRSARLRPLSKPPLPEASFLRRSHLLSISLTFPDHFIQLSVSFLFPFFLHMHHVIYFF